MTFVTHDEYRYVPGNYDENSDPDDEFEVVDVIDAIIDIKSIDQNTRLVLMLNSGNKLSIWKEEYAYGLGWGHWDSHCGFVDNKEMIAIYS